MFFHPALPFYFIPALLGRAGFIVAVPSIYRDGSIFYYFLKK